MRTVFWHCLTDTLRRSFREIRWRIRAWVNKHGLWPCGRILLCSPERCSLCACVCVRCACMPLWMCVYPCVYVVCAFAECLPLCGWFTKQQHIWLRYINRVVEPVCASCERISCCGADWHKAGCDFSCDTEISPLLIELLTPHHHQHYRLGTFMFSVVCNVFIWSSSAMD